MRQSDNPNSELIQLIPIGATIKVISFNCGYYKIEYNDKIGYINELYVEYSDLNAQNYSTLNDIKAYFTNNISKLDPIEGIWSVKLTLTFGGKSDNVPDLKRDAIIKQGDVFVIYNIEDQKVTYDKDAYYSKTSTSTLYLFTMMNFDGGKDTRYASFTGINTFKCDISEFMQETYFKLFPDENTIEEAKNKAQKSTGTGFAISSNGYIVTCNHVIDGATKIKIKGINGNFTNEYKATVALTDKNNDIAILKIDDANFTSLGTTPFTIQSTTADVGSGIYVLGYPLTATMGDEIKLTDGIISAKSGFQGDITSYQITAAVQPGNSGGPLFDKSGNIIGVVNAKHVQAENVTYAVKSSYLINLIESLSTTPTIQKVNSLKGKSLTEQVKQIKKFVYLIEIN